MKHIHYVQLAILFCGMSVAQPFPKASNGGTIDSQGLHDGPIILTDGSVKLDFTDAHFLNLTAKDSRKYGVKRFRGFLSHTHASTAQSTRFCTNGTTKSIYPQHAIEILNMRDSQPDHLTRLQLADCDVITVRLERRNGATWSSSIPFHGPMEVSIRMRYVQAHEAFGGHSGGDEGLAGEQAWAIGIKNVQFERDGPFSTSFHTPANPRYRIHSIQISGSQDKQFRLANGCSAVRILTGSFVTDGAPGFLLKTLACPSN